jgi:hypothetical protein
MRLKRGLRGVSRDGNRYISVGSVIPYPYPSKKLVPVGLPIYAHGYKILPIPVPARVILPVG